MLQRLLCTLLIIALIIPLGSASWAEQSESLEWAAEATYRIQADSPDAAFHQMEYKSYPGPIDGLASRSESWTGFFRQGGRTIHIDLNEQKRISQISLEFNQNPKSGIFLPKHLDLEISHDGKSWYRLGRVHHTVSAAGEEVQNRTLQLSFAPVSARYIQVKFPVDVWVFARHLSITGPILESASQPSVLPHGGTAKEASQPLVQVPGMDDILLVYTGAHEDKGTWKTEDFLPMLAYVHNGSYKDTMFDTMLFLPFPEVGGTKADWEKYLGDLFKEGVQLHALNEAAGKANSALSAQGKKKVILTLPYPDPKLSSFGSLGDKEMAFAPTQAGSSLQSLQNRLQAVNWYYEQLMGKWEQAQFEHLELAGIYWYKETIDSSIPEETALVKNVAQSVHEKGQKFFWIPYYGAKGYEQWKDLGFDYVFLQPNFYANQDPPEERMSNVLESAQLYHLGVEIELDQKVLSSKYYYNLFYKQLDRGHELGLDQQVTNAYYAGAKTIVYASQSTIPEARKVYDDLYRWIDGQYGKDREGPIE